MAEKRICAIPGCINAVRTRGWCGMHYMRWWSHGDPLATKVHPKGEAIRWVSEVALLHTGDGCLIWPFDTSVKGRARIRVGERKLSASKYVCELAHGPAPSPLHEPAHLCGQGHKGCVNPRHLRWKTHAENEADKIAHGTITRGERNGNSRLTEQDVMCILRQRHSMSASEQARVLNVSRRTVRDVLAGRSWAWVGGRV